MNEIILQNQFFYFEFFNFWLKIAVYTERLLFGYPWNEVKFPNSNQFKELKNIEN